MNTAVEAAASYRRDSIARVQATPVYVDCSLDIGPVSKPARLSGLVLEIETADGLLGHGFTAITDEEIVAAALNEVVAPNLLGKDAMAREHIAEALYWLLSPRGQTGYASHAISAVDIALWDIAGKRLGQPVWRLLGGARPAVTTYTTFGFGVLDRDELAETARHLAGLGHRRLKMVVGQHALARRDEPRPLDAVIAEDERRIRAVREAVGAEVELYIDANCSLDAFHALRLAQRVADCDIGFFEEPLRGNDVQRLADFRRQAPMPVAAGQNEGQLFRYRDMLAAGALDILQPNVCIGGGYSAGVKAAALAQAHGIAIDNGGAFPFHNMHLHAGLANGGLVEWHLVSVSMCHQLFRNLPERNVDQLVLPVQPGLGYELDVDAVREIGKRPASRGKGKG
ncbi:mandelate racemase/muconate lactonizing enzyme family protein [Kerstersia sp.]|uniref:mandelate racemase/muconate lactonizing enzyme family protein n=1 Tax=Kerstersia sp. TaxID=1930783 RepID=UPI003F92FEBE